MKYNTVTVNGTDYNFRLTVDDIESIERKLNVKILDYIQDYSVITMVHLLQKMWKQEDKHATSHDEAAELFELLVDEGWALQDIAQKIVWQTCVVSGLLRQSDLNRALEKQNQATQN